MIGASNISITHSTMDIYKYDYTTSEWEDICDAKLKQKEKLAAVDDYIKTKGQKVSLQEYFSDSERNSIRFYENKEYAYKCFGEPENCFERLAKSELDWDDGLSYCNEQNNFPEDLCEERTNWNKMYSYANGLYYFIESLKSEIASGKIKLS